MRSSRCGSTTASSRSSPGLDGDPDLTITADPQTLVTYLSGLPVEIEAEGDPELLGRLPQIFPFGTGAAART